MSAFGLSIRYFSNFFYASDFYMHVCALKSFCLAKIFRISAGGKLGNFSASCSILGKFSAQISSQLSLCRCCRYETSNLSTGGFFCGVFNSAVRYMKYNIIYCVEMMFFANEIRRCYFVYVCIFSRNKKNPLLVFALLCTM